MRIIDRTNQSLGNTIARTRAQSAIRYIAIHHSVTRNDVNTAVFENWWRTQTNMGAPNAVGGYHEVILANGDVELNYLPTQVSHGVGNHNADLYNICVVGNFSLNGVQPTPYQQRVLHQRIYKAMENFNVPVERVLGHNEFSGHLSNSCPGMNMNYLRNRLQGQGVPPTNHPSTPDNQFTVTYATSGFFTAADARLGRNKRTTVQPGIYYIFNQADGMINVSRLPNIPGSWINPNLQSTSSNVPTPSQTLIVGSRVRVNSNARTWATGQNIDNWVHGRIFTIQQIRSHGNELLLQEVSSWIRRSDVTLV
jgi:hypothetical protein